MTCSSSLRLLHVLDNRAGLNGLLRHQNLSHLQTRRHRSLRTPLLVSNASWQEVKDPGTGRPYYWNTDTNETCWEKPDELGTVGGAPEPHGSVSDKMDATLLQAAGVSHEQILESLQQAHHADSTGMQFWEAARSHRKDGVFEDPFSDFLTWQIEAAPDDAARESLRRLQARLSNPLLKQPAPFEF